MEAQVMILDQLINDGVYIGNEFLSPHPIQWSKSETTTSKKDAVEIVKSFNLGFDDP